MVDRVTGESFRYVDRFTVGDTYVFTTDPAVLLGWLNLFILGTAPVGGGAIVIDPPNPSLLTFDTEQITWDSTSVTWDQLFL